MSEPEEVKDEIDLMIKSLNEGIIEEPKVEEPTPVSEPEVKVEETKPEPEPKVEPEPKPEIKEPEPEPLEDKDKVISDLRTKLAEKESQKVEPKPKPEPEPLKFDIQEFVNDEDIDDFSRDPKKLNDLLNKVYQKAATDSRGIVSEEVLRAIPEIVRTNLITMQNLQKASDDFYTDNPDLKPFKKVTATVFEEIVSENPDKKFGDIMEEVGPEVRRRLELPKKTAVATVTTEKRVIPSLPQRGRNVSRSQDKPSIEPLQAELEEMSKSIGR